MSKNLPQPTPAAQAHSAKLQARILERILQQGPLTFAEYMQMALYEPGLGYYSAGAQKFGEAGDFVTAPEISALFSHCVARQCQQVLQSLSAGKILELGAGSGVMAKDILQYLQKMDALPEQYLILELSADLRQRQQDYLSQQLPDLISRVHWLDTLPKVPIQGVIVANEVIDAMGVHQFSQQKTLQERFVSCENNQLKWHLADPSSQQLIDQVHSLGINFNEGYTSEINLLLNPWLKSIGDLLARGLFLIIDYGYPRHEYYHPHRAQGTVMCHYRHRAHTDPLIMPGIQDITAHVDFTAVAQAADEAGLMVAGFTQQVNFLMNCGILDRLEKINSEKEYYQLAQQVKRLTLPNEMGELFKAMALTKDFSESLLGFSQQDYRYRLSMETG